ncbi:MAG: S8 family serine peptidase, partial [bacterium]
MNRRLLLASIALLLIIVPLTVAATTTTPRLFSQAQKGFVRSGDDVLPYAPDRILVKFTANSLGSSKLDIGLQRGAPVPGAETGIATVDALNREIGVLEVSRAFIDVRDKNEGDRLGVNRWFMLTGPEGTDVMDAVNRYNADPNVEYANPDWVAFPAVIPSDPMYADHWGHNNTAQLPDLDWGGTYDHTLPNTVGTPGFDANAQGAWDGSQGFGSSNIIIAIIDTGVDIDHPDLTLVPGWDYGDNDSNPDDNSAAAGHGTCCAGIAAAKVNNGLGACGIAPGCRVMPLKVANSAGSLYFSSIINAIYHAADNGAHIISMSLGAYLSSDPSTDAAIQYAHNAGVTILAATSNDNYSYISYPANNPYVIGVGAASPCGDRKRSSSLSYECNPGVSTDPNGYTCDGERWWGSNYGPSTPDAAGAVDVLGPTILPTTDIGGGGGYRPGDYEPFFNGTSCATPYVAGVCALIKSQNPSWTPAQVRNQLVTTAIDSVNVESGSGWDRYSGYGMVDAEAAVGGGGPTPPVAAFTGSPTSGIEPLTVNFTDQSTGLPTSWSWTFGDGGTSVDQNPVHVYDNAGTYTVTLTATNAAGSDEEIKTNYITVSPCLAPTADFAGSPTSGTEPLTVNFTDQSTNSPSSWSWTFGDGGTSAEQNPSYTYTAAGTYTVTLTAANGCGSDAVTKTDYITVTEGGTTTYVTAGGETPVAGTVSGDYVDTKVSDNVRETITEVAYTGHPVKSYSYLEHRWSFTLPVGGSVTFHLEASRTNNTEGDNVLFEYSTDGVNWSSLVTVASATETA